MLLGQKLSNVMICWMDMLVFWGNVGSQSTFCFTICMEKSSGTDVKKALTSYEPMTSPGSTLAFCMCCTKC